MKKLLGFLIVTLFVLSACSSNDDTTQKDNVSKQSETKQENVNETKNSNISEVELQEFASSLYEADKKSDIEHFDELTDDNIKTVINRHFMSENTENSKDFEKSVSNTKIYQSLDNENDYIVTLELKSTNHKEKDITWVQDTINFKTKNGKIVDFEEIGEREIFNDQD